jgi:AAA+ ATPase superfamily predicted ATPase
MNTEDTEYIEIVGRDQELQQLQELYDAPGSKLVVLYGRRRIGKTFLIRSFIQHKSAYYFDGMEEGSTVDQLQHVASQLFEQSRIALLANYSPKSWQQFFMTLLEILPQEKTVLVFDELQWLARNRAKFVSILKSYWDGHFSQKNVTIILCGSIAHYMVKQVVRSKALYGRINAELLIRELQPQHARQILKKRGEFESLKYLLIFGGIPKYLKEIDQSSSFDENIQKLLFTSGSFFWEEIRKIFFSQFKEARVYKKIISLLNNQNMSLADVSKMVKLTSGGSLKTYLENLELASFICPYQSLATKRSKEIKYKLVDGYIRFYYQFIKDREKIIAAGYAENLFVDQVKPILQPWLGFAFEVYLFKNAMWLAHKLGFANKVKEFGPYLLKAGDKKAQLDLVFIRNDSVITVIEMKFGQKQIGLEIIAEIEIKLLVLSESPYKHYTIEKVLITTAGAGKTLKDTNYFHQIVDLHCLFA